MPASPLGSKAVAAGIWSTNFAQQFDSSAHRDYQPCVVKLEGASSVCRLVGLEFREDRSGCVDVDIDGDELEAGYQGQELV
jgi:hypothetical protein